MVWRPGDHVLLRHLNRGRLSLVVAATVVEDSENLIALYVAESSPLKSKVNLDGSRIPRELPYTERFGRPWRLVDGVWRNSAVLWITKPNLPYVIGAFWEGSQRSFRGYYLNIQDPLRRHELGFDSVDHILDVQFWPDGSWNWKDEDEFCDAQAVGRFTRDEAANVRRIGETVVASWRACAWPFDQAWPNWAPETSWTRPNMPPNWDQLFSRSGPLPQLNMFR